MPHRPRIPKVGIGPESFAPSDSLCGPDRLGGIFCGIFCCIDIGWMLQHGIRQAIVLEKFYRYMYIYIRQAIVLEKFYALQQDFGNLTYSFQHSVSPSLS